MKAHHWLLLSATVCAVLAAVFFPQTLFARWDRTELNIVRSEAIDETQLVTNYSISGADRLQLFCRSGIQARNGTISYQGASSGVSLERRTLDLSAEETASETEEEWDVDLYASEDSTDYNGKYDKKINGAEVGSRIVDSNDLPRAPLEERLGSYLSNAMWTMEYWGMVPLYSDFSTRYEKLGPETLKAEYCSITDDNVPFFSIALLCVTCTMKDGEAWGIGQDTSFSMVIDEETGTLYALSITGAPDFVLPYDPMNFMVLADLMGVSSYGIQYGGCHRVGEGGRNRDGGALQLRRLFLPGGAVRCGRPRQLFVQQRE